MNQRLVALRFILSSLAISAALGLVCFAQTASASQAKSAAMAAAPDHIAMMVADWTRARDYTKEYMDAMPEDGYSFKPTPDIRSFAEQFLHLANANYAFAVAATGATNPMAGKNLEKMDDMKTKVACTKAVMDSYDFVISTAKSADSKTLGDSIKVFGQNSTRGGAFAKAFEHQTHHRGQTTIYLRLKGAKPPAEKLF
ncbi:MAG: DinB family protein [Blastocatellia bacterium]